MKTMNSANPDRHLGRALTPSGALMAIGLAATLLLPAAPLARAEDSVPPQEQSDAGPESPDEGEGAVEESAAAEETEPVEFGENFDLSVRMLGTSAFVSGDAAQFQQRHGIPENVSGGIDQFHYGREIAEDTELDLDARAIFDNHDYLLGLSIENEDKGFFKAGYRQYRTWYDGRGGYFPPTNSQFTVFNPQQGIDRGEAWAKGGLNLPDGYKLTLGYRYLFRDGNKSSTIWGDTASLDQPNPNSQRNIVPSYYNVDENRHQVELALARQTEAAQLGTGFFYEHTDLNDKLNITREPGSLTTERKVTQRNSTKGDAFGTRVFGSRRMLENKVTVSGAYAFNDLNMDLGGSRIYGAMFNSAFSPTSINRQHRDEGFLDMHGRNQMREHVGNVAVSADPIEDLQVLTSLRVRGEDMRSNADFVETSVGAGPTYITALQDLQTRSHTQDMSYAEDVEVRYKGVDNVVLYTRAQLEQNNGYISESELEPLTGAIDLDRYTDVERLRQNYSAGVKYYPLSWLNLSSEYAYRLSDYDYANRIDSTSNDAASGNRYPAYLRSQTFATHNLGFRGTVRLPYDVSLVGRYDWLETTIHTRAYELDQVQSAQVRSHLFGGTINWNPTAWWWTRVGVNYVMSTTDTGVNNYTSPMQSYFQSFNNNYITLNTSSGIAIDDKTEAEFLYHWLSAPNYRDLSQFTVSYGSRFDEHGVGLRGTRQLDDHTKLALGYGYFLNNEYFAGGNYDYHSHIITTSVEFEY